ncbi:MAG: type II secretion system protein [Planctomycetota bacterium]
MKAVTKQRGFTIAEILLVVLIIGLVSSAGTGLYVGTFKKMQVQRVAYDFFAAAQYARIAAVERQMPYKLELDMGNRAFSLNTSQWDEESEEVVQEVVRNSFCRPVQFAGDVQFESIQIDTDEWAAETETESEQEQQQTVSFSPDGTAQSAVVQIGDGRTHYTVSISAATGRAKLYFGTTDKVKVTTVDLDAEQ